MQNSYPLYKMSKLLEQHKNFIINDMEQIFEKYGEYIRISDKSTKQEFSLYVINLNDGVGCVDEDKLKDAQEQAIILQNNQHENIVKYIDSFQIGTNYFIQIESCSLSLEKWIGNLQGQIIKRSIFLKYAKEILNAIQFIHNKKLLLKDFQLRNILVSSQHACLYPEAKMIEPGNNKIKQHKQDMKGDIWSFGVCLSLMVGISLNQVKDIISGKPLKKLKNIDPDINQFIQSILISNPKNRPNLDEINLLLSNLPAEYVHTKQESINSSSITSIENTDEYYYKEGRCFETQNNYDLAIQSFLKCLEINPQHQGALFQLGYQYANKNMFDVSKQYFLKLLEINPKYKVANYNIGVQYSNKGMLDESINYFKQELEINPKYEIAYYQIGRLYKLKQNLGESIIWFNNSLYINPKLQQAYQQLGRVYYQKNILDHSLKYFMKAVEIDPKDIDAYCLMGIIYQEKHQYDDSIKQFLKIGEINPNTPTFNNHLGCCYLEQGMYDKAISYFFKELEINPKNNDANRNIGKAYERKGMFEISIKFYLKQLEIEPNNQFSLNRIKNLLNNQI